MKSLIFIFSVLVYVLDIYAIDVTTKLPEVSTTIKAKDATTKVEIATKLPDEVGKKLKGMGIKDVNETRRIIHGSQVNENRPYMVYLKLPNNNPKQQNYRRWLCGGVIIHEDYILTSAACIEDVEHFYIVSGTYKFADDDDRYTNPCIKNGAKKAIWKCVPKNYVFDGHENDNIRWMNNDIAIVKVEDGFDFTRRIRGCEFVPKPICYNNQSLSLENPGGVLSIAGWGTTAKYSDWVNRRSDDENQQILLETEVEIISKGKCKRRWGQRYANIIDNYMICTKDIGQTMSEICNEKYVDCQDIDYSDEEDEDARRNAPAKEKIPMNLGMHSAWHNETYPNGTRRNANTDGGFCENDHGGPLIYGNGVNAVVIGVISACLVKERSNKCYGPFLYTSIYKNRQFISCAIYKDVEPKCRRQFRSGVTHDEKTLTWKDHPDGPALSELAQKAPLVAPAVPAAAKVAAVPGAAPVVAPVPIPVRTPVAPNTTLDKVNAKDGFVMRATKDKVVANITVAKAA